MEKISIPVCEKYLLTVEEAAAYTNIGENRMRNLMNDADELMPYTLMKGSHRLIRRKGLESYLDRASCI